MTLLIDNSNIIKSLCHIRLASLKRIKVFNNKLVFLLLIYMESLLTRVAECHISNSKAHNIMHIFGPCTFPQPFFQKMRSSMHEIDYEASYEASGVQFRNVCNLNRLAPFICDLHNALNQQDFRPIAASFARNKKILREKNGIFSIGILIVRQLAQPASKAYVNRNNPEFECLFRLPCQPMTNELIDKFVKNVKTFTRLYTAALFSRWFKIGDESSTTQSDRCHRPPRVMVLIMLERLVANPKKHTIVHLYTDDQNLMPFISNLQMETSNLILQGTPLSEVISDLIQQVGYAFHDFNTTMGRPRQHTIPMWAWSLVAITASLALIALFIEWIIVRKKITKKRFIPGGPVADSLRSKTHIIF